MKHLFRPCPICNNQEGEILHKQVFTLPSNSPLPNEYEIVSCLNCGFVFADTSVDQTIYNNYYTLLSKYEDIEISSGGGIGSYDHLRLELTAATIHRILPDHSANILDMGCANGGLLYALKQLGYKNIMGIDPSKSCNNHVNNLGILCIEGDIFSASFSQLSKTFDCIILTHVLEHIYDLSTAIINLSSKLNENGILFVEVPDASRYSDYYIVPYYYIDCEHINHFDQNSISNLICSKGFTRLETRNIEFKVNDTNSYPAVYSIFQKTNQLISKVFNISDDAKESFLKFVEQSINNNENDKIIQKLVENQDPIIIWGVGQYTMRLLANSALSKCNIKGFIDSDSNKQGKKILNHHIFHPDFLENKNISVVICSALHYSEIIKRIEKMNAQIKVFIMK